MVLRATSYNGIVCGLDRIEGLSRSRKVALVGMEPQRKLLVLLAHRVRRRVRPEAEAVISAVRMRERRAQHMLNECGHVRLEQVRRWRSGPSSGRRCLSIAAVVVVATRLIEEVRLVRRRSGKRRWTLLAFRAVGSAGVAWRR